MARSSSIRLAAGVFVSLSAGIAGHATAAGFALMEQNVSGLGNAYAGAAAAAEDASTVWWNPAGMAKLPAGRQIAIGANWIDPSTRFRNGATVAGAGRTLGGEGGDAGRDAIVPNAYFAMEMTPTVRFGLGLNVPFGLATEYESSWMGRFQGIKAKIESLNLNPSLSWKVSDALSLGAGVSWQQFDAELSSAVNFGAAGEGSSVVKGKGDAWGYNLGALYQLTPATRIGAAYRSSIRQDLSGTVTFARPALVPAAAAPDGNISLQVSLPNSFALSAVHDLDARWQLLADATWTGWAKVQDLVIYRDTGAALSTLSLRFKDTMRYSFGANYRTTDKWTLKAGIAFDESPVPSAQFRTVRLPDNDRTWYTIGAKYRMSPGGAIDLGYAYIKVKDADINNAGGAAVGTVNGMYKAYVNIFGVQYTRTF
jgi:long-chain fatty acid transport protein